MKDKIVTKALTRLDAVTERQVYTFMAITLVAAFTWFISLGVFPQWYF